MSAVTIVASLSYKSEYVFKAFNQRLPDLGEAYLMATGSYWQSLGILSFVQENYDEALIFFMAAVAIHTSSRPNRETVIQIGIDYYYMGEIFRRQNDLVRAYADFLVSYLLALQLGTPEVHWICAGLARTLTDLGHTSDALRWYRKGLSVLESIQSEQSIEEFKVDVFAGALYAYRPFVDLLIDQYRATGDRKYIEEAFTTNERLRTSAFLNLLAKARVTQWTLGETEPEVQREQIRRKIAAVHRHLKGLQQNQQTEEMLLDRLKNLRQEWRDVQERIANLNPQQAALFSSAPVRLEEVQKSIGKDSALLEYSFFSGRQAVWVITNEQISVVDLQGDNAEDIIEEFLKTLREPLLTEDELEIHRDLAFRLFQILLEPTLSIVQGKQHLIIVPDGILYHVPFEALVVPARLNDTGSDEYSKGPHYLLNDFKISYAPSASIFVLHKTIESKDRRDPPYQIAAFGGAVYNQNASDVLPKGQRDGRFQPLNFSRDEVSRIAAIWDIPITSPHINLGEQASVERLNELDLSKYRILHFATHAVAGGEMTWTNQPALVLSQKREGTGKSGFLRFEDILELNINADLVVLSGCNTRLGPLAEAEGIIGLTRAFLYAGASSLVVSLWAVEDQSTSLLMGRFHQRLKDGEPKAEALRHAKLDLMQERVELKATGLSESLASPFYWAPFILVGDWE